MVEMESSSITNPAFVDRTRDLGSIHDDVLDITPRQLWTSELQKIIGEN